MRSSAQQSGVANEPRRFLAAGAVPALVWLLLFFIAPLIIVIILSLANREAYGVISYDFNFGNYLRAFDSLYLPAYWRTIWIASATTIICLIVSFPAAYFIALKAPKGWKRPLLVLTVVPFWTSFLIRTYSWMLLLRTEGLINSVLTWSGIASEPLRLLYSDFAVLVGQVYGEIPFMILPIYVALEKLDTRLLEASQDLGANRFWTFLRVTLPLSKPGVIAGIVLVLIPSLGAFITPDLLGGAKSVMAGNLIQNQFIQLNQPFGSALALMLTGTVMILLFIALRAGLKTEDLS